jgi:hypothetical protein
VVAFGRKLPEQGGLAADAAGDFQNLGRAVH